MTDDEIVTQWQRHLRQNIQDGRVPESLSLCSQFGQLLGEESDVGGVLEFNAISGSKYGIIYLFPPPRTNSFKQKFLVWNKSSNDNSDDDDEEEGASSGGEDDDEEEGAASGGEGEGGAPQQHHEEHHEIIGRVQVQSFDQMQYVLDRGILVSCCLGWETVDSEVLVNYLVRLMLVIPAPMRDQLELENIPFATTQTAAGRKALRDLWTAFQPNRSFTDSEWEELYPRQSPSCFEINISSRGNQIGLPLNFEAQEQVLQTMAELHQCADSIASLRGIRSSICLEVEEHFRFDFDHYYNSTTATFSKLRYHGSLTDNVINFIKRTCKRIILDSPLVTSDTEHNTWISKLLQNLDGQGVILKEVGFSCVAGFPFQQLVDILKKDAQLSGVALELPSFLELREQYEAAAIDLLRNHNVTIVHFIPLSQNPVVKYYLNLNRMGRGLAMKDSCDASQLISILREVASGHDLQPTGMSGPEFSNTTKVSLIYDLLQLNPCFKSFCDEISKAKEAKGQQMILPRKRKLE